MIYYMTHVFNIYQSHRKINIENVCHRTLLQRTLQIVPLTSYSKMIHFWMPCPSMVVFFPHPDSGLVSISNTSLTAQSIYLSSEGYPLEMPSCDSTSGSACTVSSSGVSTIRITGFDLQFSERSGECKQRLLITDGSVTSDVACDDVNNFARSVLYTSQSTRIELRLDNADTSTGGKFWIHLEGS